MANVFRKIIQSRAIYSQGDKLFVDFGRVHNMPIENLTQYYIEIVQTIPKTAKLEVVYLKFGDQGFKLTTNSGNNFMSDQLRTHSIYHIVYGNKPPHFLVSDIVPLTSAKPQL